MTGSRASAATVTAIVALLLAAAPGAGAAVPLEGKFTGTTAAGDSFSMVVSIKKLDSNWRPHLKRLVFAKSVTASVPVTCSIAEDHSEEVGFPGPLGVGRKGRFARTGIGFSGNGKVTTRVFGRFTGKRVASGTLSYRGGFFGEHCEGTVAWTATLSPG